MGIIKLTDRGIGIIPAEIKNDLCELSKMGLDPDLISPSWFVVKHVGIKNIEAIADSNRISLQETIGILTTFLLKHSNNCGEVLL